jgi:hypothetical protein
MKLALNCYLPGNMILIDTSGWSDILLGVVIGAIRPPAQMVMARRIPTSSFQTPNFQNKKYIENSVKIAAEIVTVMQPDSETCFKIASEYILSEVANYLQDKNFKVEKVESTGELKQQVENEYIRWCVESGVPKDQLMNDKRFYVFLDWVAENPHVREGLVKTGWASWENKWRAEIFKKHQAEFHH